MNVKNLRHPANAGLELGGSRLQAIPVQPPNVSLGEVALTANLRERRVKEGTEVIQDRWGLRAHVARRPSRQTAPVRGSCGPARPPRRYIPRVQRQGHQGAHRRWQQGANVVRQF
jgi:hypothetical protein